MTGWPLLILLIGCGAAGAALAGFAKLPMWALTGSVVGAAVGHLVVGGTAVLPGWVSLVAQGLIGTVIGAGVGPGALREFAKVAVPGAIAVFSILVVGIGCGLILETGGWLDPVEAIFGMIPGGAAEMVAATTSVGGDAATVAGMHVARLVIVLSTLPWLVRWSARRRRRRGEGPSSGDQPPI